MKTKKIISLNLTCKPSKNQLTDQSHVGKEIDSQQINQFIKAGEHIEHSL